MLILHLKGPVSCFGATDVGGEDDTMEWFDWRLVTLRSSHYIQLWRLIVQINIRTHPHRLNSFTTSNEAGGGADGKMFSNQSLNALETIDFYWNSSVFFVPYRISSTELVFLKTSLCPIEVHVALKDIAGYSLSCDFESSVPPTEAWGNAPMELYGISMDVVRHAIAEPGERDLSCVLKVPFCALSPSSVQQYTMQGEETVATLLVQNSNHSGVPRVVLAKYVRFSDLLRLKDHGTESRPTLLCGEDVGVEGEGEGGGERVEGEVALDEILSLHLLITHIRLLCPKAMALAPQLSPTTADPTREGEGADEELVTTLSLSKVKIKCGFAQHNGLALGERRKEPRVTDPGDGVTDSPALLSADTNTTYTLSMSEGYLEADYVRLEFKDRVQGSTLGFAFIPLAHFAAARQERQYSVTPLFDWNLGAGAHPDNRAPSLSAPSVMVTVWSSSSRVREQGRLVSVRVRGCVRVREDAVTHYPCEVVPRHITRPAEVGRFVERFQVSFAFEGLMLTSVSSNTSPAAWAPRSPSPGTEIAMHQLMSYEEGDEAGEGEGLSSSSELYGPSSGGVNVTAGPSGVLRAPTTRTQSTPPTGVSLSSFWEMDEGHFSDVSSTHSSEARKWDLGMGGGKRGVGTGSRASTPQGSKRESSRPSVTSMLTDKLRGGDLLPVLNPWGEGEGGVGYRGKHARRSKSVGSDHASESGASSSAVGPRRTMAFASALFTPSANPNRAYYTPNSPATGAGSVLASGVKSAGHAICIPWDSVTDANVVTSSILHVSIAYQRQSREDILSSRSADVVPGDHEELESVSTARHRRRASTSAVPDIQFQDVFVLGVPAVHVREVIRQRAEMFLVRKQLLEYMRFARKTFEAVDSEAQSKVEGEGERSQPKSATDSLSDTSRPAETASGKYTGPVAVAEKGMIHPGRIPTADIQGTRVTFTASFPTVCGPDIERFEEKTFGMFSTLFALLHRTVEGLREANLAVTALVDKGGGQETCVRGDSGEDWFHEGAGPVWDRVGGDGAVETVLDDADQKLQLDFCRRRQAFLQMLAAKLELYVCSALFSFSVALRGRGAEEGNISSPHFSLPLDEAALVTLDTGATGRVKPGIRAEGRSGSSASLLSLSPPALAKIKLDRLYASAESKMLLAVMSGESADRHATSLQSLANACHREVVNLLRSLQRPGDPLTDMTELPAAFLYVYMFVGGNNRLHGILDRLAGYLHLEVDPSPTLESLVNVEAVQSKFAYILERALRESVVAVVESWRNKRGEDAAQLPWEVIRPGDKSQLCSVIPHEVLEALYRGVVEEGLHLTFLPPDSQLKHPP
eukprot:gene1635-1906_t